MRIVFIVNSQIRGSKGILEEIKREFNEVSISIVTTQFSKHAISLATEATHDQYDFIIAVGGDGTLNEVLNGMMAANVPINSMPVLGMIQRGSANDFARTIGVKQTAKELKKLIDDKHHPKIDIGKIELLLNEETPKYFINICGLGLGPEAVLIKERAPKILGPEIAYYKSIIQGFMSYDRKPIHCTGDDWQWTGSLLQMAIGNGRYFGNGMCVCPDAKVDDGLFQVALFGDLSLKDYFKNLGNLKKGNHLNHPDAHYFKTKMIQIENSGDQPCGIEADGEVVGYAPATISVVPNAIEFLM